MPDPTIATVVSPRTATATTNDPAPSITMTAGKAYVCVLWQTTTASRTFSFDNGGTDTFTAVNLENAAVARKVAIGYCIASATGSYTINANASGSATYRWGVYEITPGAGDTLSLYATSSYTDITSDTSHQCAAASGFSPPAQTAVVCAMQISTTRTPTAGTGYTLMETGSLNGDGQSKVFSSLSTDEQAAYTLSANSTTAGVVIGYTSSGAGGGNTLQGRIVGGAVGRSGVLGA